MAKMTAIMSGKRAIPTWLTGAAGLLLLVTAVVMMVCAPPRVQHAQPGPPPGSQLASWVWVTHGPLPAGPKMSCRAVLRC